VRLFCLISSLLAIGCAAQADETPLRKLLTADEAKTWQAVGRIDLKNAGFCTGALIAPNLVLTAAHCMFHPKTNVQLKPEEMEFKAGLRSGRAGALRKARRVVIHKDYKPGRDVKLNYVASDIALIELELPITANAIKAFTHKGKVSVGDEVKVVSYAQDRAEVPSIEEPCKVLGRDVRALVLTCNVDYGASGSPIFVEENGALKIASVVSAKAVVKGQKVALGASLGEPLEQLLSQLRANRGVFQGKRPNGKSISEQLGNVQQTAKILRP